MRKEKQKLAHFLPFLQSDKRQQLLLFIGFWAVYSGDTKKLYITYRQWHLSRLVNRLFHTKSLMFLLAFIRSAKKRVQVLLKWSCGREPPVLKETQTLFEYNLYVRIKSSLFLMCLMCFRYGQLQWCSSVLRPGSRHRHCGSPCSGCHAVQEEPQRLQRGRHWLLSARWGFPVFQF